MPEIKKDAFPETADIINWSYMDDIIECQRI